MRWWHFIVLASLIAFALFALDWRNREAFVGEPGFIEQGGRLGVRIGMMLSEAEQHLSDRGYSRLREYEQLSPSASCGGRLIAEGELRTRYIEPSRLLRGGSVCLVTREGMVTAFGWKLGPSAI